MRDDETVLDQLTGKPQVGVDKDAPVKHALAELPKTSTPTVRNVLRRAW